MSNGFWKIICRLAIVSAAALSTGRRPSSRLPSMTAPSVARLQPHQHLGEGRLAAAGFADDGDRLRLARVEIQLLVGLDRLRLAGEEDGALLDRVVLGQVVHLQHDVARLGRHAADAPRRPAHPSRSRRCGCSARRGNRGSPPAPSGSGRRRSARRRRCCSAGRNCSRAGAGAAAAAGRGWRPADGCSCRRRGPGSRRRGRAYRDGASPRRLRGSSPTSTASPEYMTVMRSQVSRISPRLCEM